MPAAVAKEITKSVIWAASAPPIGKLRKSWPAIIARPTIPIINFLYLFTMFSLFK